MYFGYILTTLSAHRMLFRLSNKVIHNQKNLTCFLILFLYEIFRTLTFTAKPYFFVLASQFLNISEEVLVNNIDFYKQDPPADEFLHVANRQIWYLDVDCTLRRNCVTANDVALLFKYVLNKTKQTSFHNFTM